VCQSRLGTRARLAKKAYDNGRIYAKLGYYTPARSYFQVVQREFPDTPWNAWALLGEAQSWAKQKYWEEANAALERLAATDPPPPDEVANEAKKLASYVKGRLVATRGGSTPASAP
jgi:outer membrane protein assembly factor BamD (BamD/ComL family)